MSIAVVSALVRRDYQITRSYRMAFVLDSVFGVLNLAVYFFISETFVDASTAPLGGAPSYFAFAAVGMVVGLVITAAAAGAAERVREEQLTGTFEALLVHPVRSLELSVGLVGFPLLFGLARAIVYLGIAAVWMDLDASRASWLGLVAVLLGTGAALATLGILSGAAVLLFKRGTILTAVAIFGMTMLSGAVFPISVLPDWVQPISEVIPIRFALNGVRDALFRGEGWGTDAVALMAFGALGIPLAAWVFDGALRIARRTGSVGQY
jgi:ABC-2 type transport system permease protein